MCESGIKMLMEDQKSLKKSISKSFTFRDEKPLPMRDLSQFHI